MNKSLMFFSFIYFNGGCFVDLKLMFKGLIVGIGKIIPGVSGSMLAITLGVYDKVLEAVTNFFDNPKKNAKLLFNFALGVLLAIILFSKLILFLLNNYYQPTMYLFLGLIVGTLLPFTKELKWNLKNNIIFLVFFGLTLIFAFKTTNINYVFGSNILDYLYTALLGVIDAFTSIVPGISGTAIFMLLGSYEFVLQVLANPFSLLFIVYGVGMMLGIIIICYIMHYLLKNKRQETNMAILAFMISSVLMLLMSIKDFFSVFMILMFGVGVFMGYFFDK